MFDPMGFLLAGRALDSRAETCVQESCPRGTGAAARGLPVCPCVVSSRTFVPLCRSFSSAVAGSILAPIPSPFTRRSELDTASSQPRPLAPRLTTTGTGMPSSGQASQASQASQARPHLVGTCFAVASHDHGLDEPGRDACMTVCALG